MPLPTPPRNLKVTFEPDGVTMQLHEGETLLEIARRANVDISSPCGGEGLCGRCAVQVKGEHDVLGPTPPHHDPSKGLSLACRVRPKGDVTVTVPPGSRSGAVRILTESREVMVELSPLVRRVVLELPRPTISDNVCDLMRVSRGLGFGLHEITLPLPLLQRLGETVRASDWRVAATVATDSRPPRLIGLGPVDPSGRTLGLAMDIGTTTVVGRLIDLESGLVLSTAARENGQIPFGEDVIARIQHANESETGLRELRGAVFGTIKEIVLELLEEGHASADEVVASSIAGNTVMEHLFMGVQPRSIRLEPYVPTFCQMPDITAGEAGLPVNPDGIVYLLPSRAGFVGGDVTADVLACGMHKRDEVAMMIDVGTNGEVVLGNREWLMACSCSAGPAFEGGEVKHGMRAAKGAIERVEIDDDLSVSYQTIGETAPRGICGSGLIDLIAELFYHGFIDRAGTLVKEHGRVVQLDPLTFDAFGRCFIIADAGQSGTGAPIYISEGEIKNVIRTKAAMYAACSVLLKEANLTFDDLDRVYISGGFGRYLDSWKSRLLGLLPDIEEWRFEFMGNGSLEGARMALLSSTARKEARSVFSNMTYVELSVSARFMDEFTSAMFLPHTDLDRFPQVRKALDGRKTEDRGGAGA